ncbi:MAG: efflux transporter outer membrane subunit [Acidobacteriota bacterium]
MQHSRLFSLFALAIASFGCAAVGPDYQAPEPLEPDAWQHGGRTTVPIEAPEVLAEWWQRLDDPTLTAWIERALLGSPDVDAATARLRRARALLTVQRADRLPSLDAEGSASFSDPSDATAPGVDSQELYSAGFDASWELDLFGRVRRSVEAAEAELTASTLDLATVRTSLAAEVAGAYIDLRTFQQRLQLAVANRDAQYDTFELARSRFNAGLVSRLDVEQARANLERTRSQIPTLRAGIERSANRLLVLAGEAPGSDQALSTVAPLPATPTRIAVGIPADALRRRPDVRAAERRLAAETARIGIATAALYPRFGLTGSIGVESLDLDGLTDSGAGFFGLVPSVSWRLFDRRAVRADIEAQTATQAEALAAYEATVLRALEEVENSLVGYVEEVQRQEALRTAVAAAQRAASLAADLYRSGLRTFQDVLDAQRTLLDLQDQLALSEGSTVLEVVRLYKALGGGWTPLAPLDFNDRGVSAAGDSR